MDWLRKITKWFLEADDTLEASGAEQAFEPTDGTTGDSVSTTLGGDAGWIDVRRFETATARIEAGGVGTTATLYGKVTEAATEESVNSTAIASGSDADVVRQRDISDLSYLRVTENSDSDTNDTHALRLVLK